MTDFASTTIWPILSKAFDALLHTLQATMPGVQMTAGYSKNEAFLFRAFAQYSASSKIVDITFDIHVKDFQVRAFGDIAWEDGLIITSLMDCVVGPETINDQLLVTWAKIFASRCNQNTGVIANALTEGRA